MKTVADVDQLRGDPQSVRAPPNASFEDGLDAQRFADLPDIQLPALEREGGRAGRDLQTLDPREHVEEFL